MILKKLEMQGFKSFFDKTAVNFQTGINAVVGPNGCGKSNIADAIRWVLGEQSPKQLRGEKMEDLIFAGSESRRPLGMAEVSLTVEANGTEFPSPYNSFSEVEVTRRLYRSGESEFLINNKSCRLRDIRELFLDTGMNPKAYAVIDQGSVGNIISARPEDRRVFFEEAAGIAKYKERKAAALRKLESTQQNLVRLQDVIREVRRQIRSLTRQARKAERYNLLKDEISGLELRLLCHRIEAHHAEEISRRDRLSGLEELAGTLRGEAAAAEARLAEKRLSLVELEKDTAGAREDFYTRRGRLETVSHQLSSLQARLEQIAAAAARGEAETERLTRHGIELREETSRIRNELAAITERRSSRETLRQELTDSLDEITEETGSLENRLQSRNAAYVEEMRREADVGSRIAETEARRAAQEREVARLAGERERSAGERKELSSEERALAEARGTIERERVTLGEAAEAAAAALEDARREAAAAAQDIAAAREELTLASSRLSSLSETERALSGWSERIQEALGRVMHHREIDDGVLGILAGFIQVAPEHERALEAVMGERLRHLLVASLETAVTGARILQEEGDVRGTLMPLHPRRRPASRPLEGPGITGELRTFVTAAADVREAVDHSLDGVLLVESLERAAELWRESAGDHVFVTPAGEVLHPDGSLTAGRPNPTRELLPLLRKIREARETADAARERIGELTRRGDEAGFRLEKVEAEAARLRDESHRLEMKSSSMEKELLHVREKLESNSKRDALLTEAAVAAESEKRRIDESLTGLRARAASIEEGRGILEREIASLKTAIADIRRRRGELDGRMATLRVEMAADGERASSLESRLEHIAAGEKDAAGRGEALAAELAELSREEEESRTRLAALEDERGMLARSKDEGELRLAEAQRRQADLAGLIGETEEALRGLRVKTEEVAREAGDLRVSEAETQVRLEHLAGRVREIAGRGPEEIWDAEAKTEILAEEQDGIETRFREAEERLQAMGPVNLAAIGDEQELRERLDFLAGQQADLEKASQDLYDAIQRINRTSRTLFLETFESINEQFQKIFPLLFEDGHAMLQLTAADDPLDAGIEVLAQPAGKKLQSISLFSGGEKALAALALLLAIFVVKPTPFCLLDEVDAPLDDHNTDRFLELLSQSINGSQLVVITHNKRTMETANHMVGVTMADPGVSCLLSVRLNDN